ncbi:hypothetical protein L6164_005289 [Bauhinia variegata]|uniref:Uncharacterized protein n=1 Tax=Bauhinia variegata TaxID=167791 RepID=A0ACB9PSY9_BAUVA|nr:hypothetical protein L6164_005289 [Bauhinia variegata]
MVTSEKSLSTALNATTIGSGTETIVFAHGFGTDQSIWDKITPFFAQNYCVVVFDWPFSGAVKDQSLYDPVKYSSYEAFADELISLLDELNLKDTIFVGHSMSGMIGCIASVKRPRLFKRLVLLAASPRYLNTEDYEGGFRNSDVEMLLSSIESDYENWASGFASIAVDPTDALSVAKFEKCLKSMRAEVALPLAKSIFYSDYRDLLDKVETPCTIVQTTKDLAVPHSAAVYMEKKIKGKSTLEIIDTQGHFPQLTAHLRLVEVLKGALGIGTL